jgi:hypothetical protein
MAYPEICKLCPPCRRLHAALAALSGEAGNQGPDGIIMNQRPLSPHLQVWRWGPHMLVSILHRATGDGMAIVGLGVLVWWLGALASGPNAYATFQSMMGSPVGLLVLVGLSWACLLYTSDAADDM